MWITREICYTLYALGIVGSFSEMSKLRRTMRDYWKEHDAE